MSYTIEKVRAALGQINDVVPDQQPRGFSILLNQIFDNSAPDDLAENLAAIAEALLRDSVGVLEAGPILTTLVARFAALSTAAQVEAGPPLLELVTPRAASFAEQDLALTRAVADALERRGRFAAAAEVLQRIDAERAGPDGEPPSADDRARHYIRIVRCYLEDDARPRAPRCGSTASRPSCTPSPTRSCGSCSCCARRACSTRSAPSSRPAPSTTRPASRRTWSRRSGCAR